MRAPVNYTKTTQSVAMGFNPTIILRREATNKKGLAPLNLQIFISGKRVAVPLDLHIPPSQFDNKKRRVKSSYPGAEDFNLLLDKYLGKANKVIINSRLAGEPMTPTVFKSEFDDRAIKKSFTDFWRKEMEYLKAEMNYATYKHHKSVLEKFTDFRKDVRFADLTPKLLEDFNRFMQLKRGNDTNTRATAMKKVHKYLLIAKKRGLNISDPFKQFKIRQKKTYKNPLLELEVKQLRQLYDESVLSEPMQDTLKIYLFMCYTGLRPSDAKRFNTKMIDGDEIVLHPKKVDYTGKRIGVPLTTEARELIGNKKGKVFTVCADQTMNDHLKDIAERLKIHKRLTMRVARDSFATIFIERGGDVMALKEILGHEDLETTLVYTRIRPKYIREQMKVMEGVGT